MCNSYDYKSVLIHQLQHAYTLLELLIVLFILSLLAALLVPRLTTWYDSVQAVYTRNDVLVRLSSLSYQAFQQGRDFQLTLYPPEKTTDNPLPTNKIPLTLPEGWQVLAETPIRFRANGACNGGIVRLQYKAQTVFRAELVPPFCQAHLLDKS